MRIIQGELVDLIDPFPKNQLERLWQWTRFLTTTVLDDSMPRDKEPFVQWIDELLPFTASYGVIAKNGAFKHEAPIVGFVLFEPAPPCTAILHAAGNRRAGRLGLLSEAVKMGIEDVFLRGPDLLRVSAGLLSHNKLGRELIENAGLHKDGYFRNMVRVKGKPASIIHYGLVRPEHREPIEENEVHQYGRSDSWTPDRPSPGRPVIGDIRRSEKDPDPEL